MSAITAVLYRDARIRATNFTFVIWDLCYPMINLLVFGVGIDAALGLKFGSGGLDYNAFFLAGCLGLGSFAIPSNTAWSFFMDRDNGIFYEILTYPMTRAEYLFGRMLFTVSLALAQAVLTLAAARYLLHVPFSGVHILLLVVMLALGPSAWFYVYAALALRIRRNDAFNAVTSILYFVLIFVSSMFYPTEPLPRWFAGAALANPITWQVDVLRYATIGLGDPRRVAVEAAGFVVFAVAASLAAVRVLNRQE
ncbi:MAG TPA: ABC transporter permease [Candidatus Acidoferrales bacterium]|nr:ABC transporter permease [Candidatus Acidoferrales bacterium]